MLLVSRLPEELEASSHRAGPAQQAPDIGQAPDLERLAQDVATGVPVVVFAVGLDACLFELGER